MEREEGIWTTKDGRNIKIVDMDNDHLINSIRLLRRIVGKMRLNHELSVLSALKFVNGDMAQYAIESSLDLEMQISNEEWLDCYTAHGDLMKEVIRRDILYMLGAPFFSYMDRFIGAIDMRMSQ